MSRGRLSEHFVHAAFGVVRASRILHTPWGRNLFVASYFQYKRYLEDPYTRLVQRRPELFRGGDILDAGANVGYTATLFAGAMSEGSRVYAFEPEPFNVELLTAAIARRGFAGKIIPVQAAVGAEDGSVELWINPGHPADHRVFTPQFETQAQRRETITVPLVALDSFVRQRDIRAVGFIKIDVQGFELAVCKGMEGTLSANPQAAVGLEYMPEAIEALGFRPHDLLDWFWQRGFQSSFIDTGEPVREAPALSRGGYVDLLMERPRP